MNSYCAFISYRHLSPDMEIAGKLHSMIETYRIPKGLREQFGEGGQKHPGKVFRDQEELPLSSDLGKDIEDALDNSEWLICICTPRYLESQWCMRELEYFIGKHGRNKVLAVLAEGEPQNSFPEALLSETDENGQTVYLEPLAADVRGSSIQESLKKLKKEKLRILAPMLGVSFDNLYQRQKRRNMKKGMIMTSAAAVLMGGFLAYSLVQNNRINEQRISAARNQCDLLVEKTEYYTSQYRITEAREMALKAHEVSGTIDDYGEERIQGVLKPTCYRGDFSIDAKLDITPGAAVYTTDFLSPDDTKVVEAVSPNMLVCCDAITGEQLWSDQYESDITSARWKQDGSEVVVTAEWAHTLRVLDAQTGDKLYELHIPWAINAVYDGDDIVICFSQGIIRWSPLEDPEGSSSIPYIIQSDECQHHSAQVFGGGKYVVLENEEIDSVTFLVADLEKDRQYIYKTPYGSSMTGYTVSPECDKMFIHQYGKIYVCDLETDEVLWETEITDDNITPVSISHFRDPVWSGDYIINNNTHDISDTEYSCSVYNASDGTLLLELEDENVICVMPGDEYLLCLHGLYRISDGHCVAAADSKLLAADSSFKQYLSYAGGFRQTAVTCGSQYSEENYTGTLYKETNPEHYLISPDERFYVVVDVVDPSVHIIDMDARETDEPVNLSDPATIQSVIWNFNLGSQPERTRVVFSPDSKLVALGSELGNVAVYEMETGRQVCAFDDLYYKSAISELSFSKDAEYLIAADYYPQEVFCVYSVTDGKMLYMMHALETVSDWGFDEDTGDAVIVYEDGSAICGDLFTSAEELYSYAKSLKE